MPIQVAISTRHATIAVAPSPIRAAARTVLRGEGVTDADISIALVDDAISAEINERYLRHRGPTDVITFPLHEPGKPLAAELVVNVDRAAVEARRRRHAVDGEVILYVVHGLLHLCGYDDHSPGCRRSMRARERHFLRLIRTR